MRALFQILLQLPKSGAQSTCTGTFEVRNPRMMDSYFIWNEKTVAVERFIHDTGVQVMNPGGWHDFFIDSSGIENCPFPYTCKIRNIACEADSTY